MCLGVALLTGWIPTALAAAVGLALPLMWLWRSSVDMRGTPAVDATGRLQSGAMLTATLALAAWTFWALWWR